MKFTIGQVEIQAQGSWVEVRFPLFGRAMKVAVINSEKDRDLVVHLFADDNFVAELDIRKSGYEATT